ncbi:hypothetical protein U9M48_042466 [Paspalum notatum var. saurae]|uniref:Uncharacterized protein n=1 Tax=Paspalum notatum var. saurae TaxID=547442 RepID=A0AAQ3UQW0_PASNO
MAPSEEEPMYHERKLSGSTTSFSSPAPSCASSSTSTDYHPAANKLSSESIPFTGPGPDDLAKLSSISSTSSYESFFHIEASDFGGATEFLDLEPAAATTLAPAVQTMKAAAYDPKRLPSSMFRTRSTSPAEWSATSNESLFSIQLSSSGDLTALYADLYYDAAGLPRFPSARKLPSLSPSSSARSGGLCVTHDCARCSGGGCSKTRKSVRFAATESVVSGECKHSVVVSTLEVAMEETTAASATKAAAGGGWCELGCCLTSPPKVWTWWPRCCGCCGCGCQCKWWL